MDNLPAATGFWLTIGATLLWAIVALAPWRPWSTRERLEPATAHRYNDLQDVTVIIPARNEAANIGQTLRALAQQGGGMRVILVDDQSTDGTAHAARGVIELPSTILRGKPLPAGWSGKLWALEQGRRLAQTPFTLLLDADIALAPDVLAAARDKLRDENLDLVSLMATPHMRGGLEKLSMPAFVYFFKLLYPFRLANSRHSAVAAAAGGFVLIRTPMLDEIGAFESFRGELIDDCALAREIKRAGGTNWLGLSRSVQSQRHNQKLADLWRMISRTAFTQLRYSSFALCACTVVMVVGFLAPLLAIASANMATRVAAVAALVMMIASYIPILKFYERAPVWALTLPLAALLYLAMTWGSAIGYWRGQRATWKDRVYREDASL